MIHAWYTALHLLACCSCLLRGAGACLVVGALSSLLLAMWDMKAVHAICKDTTATWHSHKLSTEHIMNGA
jgi:hypothetical protein